MRQLEVTDRNRRVGVLKLERPSKAACATGRSCIGTYGLDRNFNRNATCIATAQGNVCDSSRESYRKGSSFRVVRTLMQLSCRSLLRIFIPNELKEAMAMENARLLMQAQSDLGLLGRQMAASEQGTRKRIEGYERPQGREQKNRQ